MTDLQRNECGNKPDQPIENIVIKVENIDNSEVETEQIESVWVKEDYDSMSIMSPDKAVWMEGQTETYDLKSPEKKRKSNAHYSRNYREKIKRQKAGIINEEPKLKKCGAQRTKEWRTRKKKTTESHNDQLNHSETTEGIKEDSSVHPQGFQRVVKVAHTFYPPSGLQDLQGPSTTDLLLCSEVCFKDDIEIKEEQIDIESIDSLDDSEDNVSSEKVTEDNDDQSNARENGDDEEMDAKEVAGPSHADAYEAFQTAMYWLEKQPEGTATHLLLLKRLRDMAAMKRT